MRPVTAADRVGALQRSVGNRATTRLLARYKSSAEQLRDAIASGDWNTVARLMSDFDAADAAQRLGSLTITQLRYLDDAINRRGFKGGERLSAQVRTAMKATGVASDRTKAGRGYGKATGKYGKVTDGNPRYSVEVDLYFRPDPALVGADEISWIQTVRTIDDSTHVSNEPGVPDQARTTEKQWMLDRLVGRKYGWYGINNDRSAADNVHPWVRNGTRRTAHMYDQPGWNQKSMVWEFEAAAVCRKSSAANADPVGTVYAVITWGFTVKESGKVKTHEIKVWNKPSPRQLEAVANWNRQARGELAAMNAPNQKQLPDLM